MTITLSSRIRCRILALFTVACLLAGCGQRGPLYLPDEVPEEEQQEPR